MSVLARLGLVASKAPSPAPTFKPGLPAALGIATIKPRAFSDAYARSLAEATKSLDANDLHFLGVALSRIDKTGLAPAGGRWCLYFYSAAKRKEMSFLLTYPATGEPEMRIEDSKPKHDATLEVDPVAIKLDSDEALAKRPGLDLASENNGRVAEGSCPPPPPTDPGVPILRHPAPHAMDSLHAGRWNGWRGAAAGGSAGAGC